jgi:hypothetical protein
MMKQTVEEAAREAIHKHYNCNGTYPCSEREYCEHCNGHNTAFDCCECGADEFKEGFIAGANWRINSVWHSNNRTYKAQKTALVIFKNGKSKVYDNLTDLTIESLWGGVDRFAYIEDLLPNMEV